MSVGIRVSKSKDVKTSKEITFDSSDKSMFAIQRHVIKIPITEDVLEYVIPHNLGYAPMFLVAGYSGDDTPAEFGGPHWEFQQYGTLVDDKNIYINSTQYTIEELVAVYIFPIDLESPGKYSDVMNFYQFEEKKNKYGIREVVKDKSGKQFSTDLKQSSIMMNLIGDVRYIYEDDGYGSFGWSNYFPKLYHNTGKFPFFISYGRHKILRQWQLMDNTLDGQVYADREKIETGDYTAYNWTFLDGADKFAEVILKDTRP